MMNPKLLKSCAKINLTNQEERNLKKFSKNNKNFSELLSQFIDYEPEIERYGGKEFIKIAEQHFYNSSETVRKLMTHFEVWNNEMAIGVSLQVQIMFAHALGFSKEEAQQFFEYYYKNWLFVFDEKTRKSDVFQSQFKILNHQSSIDFANSLWLSLEEDADFEEEFLTDWYLKNQILAKQFELNNLDYSIYESLLHMTNNRLGISNFDEVLLAFILKNSFERM